MSTRLVATRLAESAVATVAGGALGGLTATPVGLTVAGAAVGAANGAISGWRGVYAWRSTRGTGAFVLDSSWALITTATGLVSHTVSSLQRDRGGYVAALSERQDRHVYATGMRLRRGFATTWGNVVTGAGDVSGDSPRAVRRRRLVTDHEDVHVWQARALGPLYPLGYIGWTIGGGLVGAVRWVLGRRRAVDGTRPRFTASVEASAYYANPFEWWAYSRDDNWPPSHVDARAVWRRPLVRSFRAGGGIRGRAGTRAAPR